MIRAVVVVLLLAGAAPARAQSLTVLREGASALSEMLARSPHLRTLPVWAVARDADDEAGLLLTYLQQNNPKALGVLAENPELAMTLRGMGLEIPETLPSQLAHCETAVEHVAGLGEAVEEAAFVAATQPTEAEQVYRQVFDAFESKGVRYVVLGGQAVKAHGVARASEDLDIAIELTDSNLSQIVAVAESLGLRPRLPVPLSQLGSAATVQGWMENKHIIAFTLQHPTIPGAEIDLVLNPRISFSDMLGRSERLSTHGRTVPVASVDDLIEMKSRAYEDAGRAKDLKDIELLRGTKIYIRPAGPR